MAKWETIATFKTTSFMGAVSCLIDFVGGPRMGDNFELKAGLTDTDRHCWSYHKAASYEFGHEYDITIIHRPDCWYDVKIESRFEKELF